MIYNKIQIYLTAIDSFIDMNENNIEEINKKLVDLVRNEKICIEINVENYNFLKAKRTNLGLNLMEIMATFNKDDLNIIKNIFNKYVDNQDILEYGLIFHERLTKILSYSLQKKCSILYDAEQSYIQKILDSTAYFYASIYNKDFPVILQTVQCYLKDSPHKINSFINFSHKNNIKLGMKIVRGAYIVEETKLANLHGYEKLNWDNIDKTNNNYNSMMKKLVSEYRNGDKVILYNYF